MTSCFMHYDIIYYPFLVNSQYLKLWGVDSPETRMSKLAIKIALIGQGTVRKQHKDNSTTYIHT